MMGRIRGKSLGLSSVLFLLLFFGGVAGLSMVHHAYAKGEHIEYSEHVKNHGSENSIEHHEAHEGGGHEEVAGFITMEQSGIAMIPFIVCVIPVFAAFLVIVFGKSDKKRDIVHVSATALVFLLCCFMLSPIVSGIHVDGELYKGLSFSRHFMAGFDMTFKVDPAGLLVGAVVSFLWLLAAIYGVGYMTMEENRTRYDVFTLLTLTANMGVVFAGDFLTVFFFFEGLILFPYAIIAHKHHKEASRGATMYLYIGEVASLSLLVGIMLMYSTTGNLSVMPVAAKLEKFASIGNLKYVICALMVMGFGGKAGLFFEHVWLPNAHPVAPTPGSALLSGAMIKAGAYGIFRVVDMLFVPASFSPGRFASQWLTMQNIGFVIIWVGVVTMFFSVLSALVTSNGKRMLAFHSVSQMGYIVMGIGCAAYMGSDGAMGLAGAMYHIINHALFKTSLFLCVGAVYFRTHELDMYKLGGLWRNMPVVAVGLFIAACGISGLPLFNGFASKTLLHHAILEAYEFSGKTTGVRSLNLKFAEIIFMITAGGTFASNIKLFILTFLGKRQEKHDDIKEAPKAMQVAIIMVSVTIMLIGIFPNWLLEHLIGPALSYFNYDTSSHAYHMLYNVHATNGVHSVIPILYPIGDTIKNAGEAVVHNLLGGGSAVILGGMYFIPGMVYGMFHIEVPEVLQLTYYYAIIFNKFKSFCKGPASNFGDFVDKFISFFACDIWLPLSEAKSLVNKLGKSITILTIDKLHVWEVLWTGYYENFTDVCSSVDKNMVDWVVNAVAGVFPASGECARKTQTGYLQHYALVMVGGIAVVISSFLYYWR